MANPPATTTGDMNAASLASRSRTSTGHVAIHPLDPEDAAVTAAMHAMASSSKGARPGSETRGQFDALMESVLPRDDVTFEADTLGGVPGLGVHPADWRSSEAIVHLHGDWFNFGSDKAYRHLVGHIAVRACARAFVPDYRLAPEHPFPAATDDALACYQDSPRGTFTGLHLRETPLEAIWHSSLRRALPAKPPP